MSRRKGEITGKMVKRDWPFHIYTLVPPNGFGTMLNRMHEFCRQFDYATAGGFGPGKPESCYWCFRSAADAEAFRAWYAAQQ